MTISKTWRAPAVAPSAVAPIIPVAPRIIRSPASKTPRLPRATVEQATAGRTRLGVRRRLKAIQPRPIMSQFYKLLARIQADRGITEDEIQPIREQLDADSQLDLDDVKLLVELYCNAESRCQAFDELFFEVLEKVLLADGQISPSEEFYLLKMLYSDREIREPEREFLRKLRKQSKSKSASFEALFDTAMDSPAKNWCVGGRQS
jgi:hypothetical protein